MRILTFASLCFVALSPLACAGSLEDPERFTGNGCPPDRTPEVILQGCTTSGCHAASQPAASLDLASPDPARRLIGVSSSTCDGETLVTADGQGFFFDKLTAPTPRCGSRMPLGGKELTAEEVQCLRSWLASGVEGSGL